MKLLVSLNKKELGDYLKFTNSFIIGLKNYAVNYFEFSLEEIKEVLEKYQDIEVFVSINKNIFNKDIKDLEEKLFFLSKLNIKGILFYDLSILEIVKRLKLPIPLCYHGTHLVTNYNICNYYYNKGVPYAFLSSEITKEEIKEIASNTKAKLMVYFLGHPIISHSKRKLVSNYYEYIGKEKSKNLNVIKEKGKDKKYYIMEDNLGTNILTYDILNGTEAFIYLKNDLEYAVLDNKLIVDDLFFEILKLYHDNLEGIIEDLELIEKVKDLIGSNDGFFSLKTIYKVK